MRKLLLIFALNIFLFSGEIYSQSDDTDTLNGKIPLDHTVYESWKRLEKTKISFNGEWISYEINPQKGDGILIIANPDKGFSDTIIRGYDLSFSPNNDFAAFKIKPEDDLTRKAKLNKKKKEDMPKDSLGILTFNSGNKIIKIPFLKSFTVSQENTSLISFLNENKSDKKDTLSKNKADIYDFTIMNPVLNTKEIIKSVTEYYSSKNGEFIAFTILEKGKTDTSLIAFYNVKKEKTQYIFGGKGNIKNVTLDDKGTQLAFQYTEDTAKVKTYSIYYWNSALPVPKLVINKFTPGMPSNWEVPENTQLNFAEDGSKLFFKTARIAPPEPKDTLLEEEKFKVDVWNWNDPELQTEQLKNLDKDKTKNYLAVWNIPGSPQYYDSVKVIQLADSLIDEVKIVSKGKKDIALGYSFLPYVKIQSWEEAEYTDVYTINLKTGERKLIIPKVQFGAEISPTGNYVVYYETSDSSWYSYSINTDEKISLTKSLNIKFGNELFDLPAQPNPYGFGGWVENDEFVLLYDRYDIWKASLDNITVPINITNSRISKDTYRYIKLDNDAEFIGRNDKILLRGVNEDTYSEAFYFADLNIGVYENPLVMMDKHFSDPIKAKKSGKIIWQEGSYTEFPDLWYSDIEFNNIKQVSLTNPQMNKYLWGSVELVHWKNFDGEDMKGLLYKPENFDYRKKYPMIVYFYEKYADKIYSHYLPNPSRSVINFPLYNSNGYIIFIPDITYKIGYPGESAYNAIISGTQYLIDQGFVDKDNLGLQGQSWGGYQTAYMVTQTGLFKAAMAGAPVSNMTSAYGGIRWESGKNRIFQYETGQSRIGGTLWEKLDLYIKNSPIFFADKVTTPLLIMSNDTDGAVPWQEGIQYFVSLRRLGKPAWLLSYNGEEHNLTKWPNRKDLSIRMKQFFDHYLKGAPAPVWMEDGIPALDKGRKTGYELKD